MHRPAPGFRLIGVTDNLLLVGYRVSAPFFAIYKHLMAIGSCQVFFVFEKEAHTVLTLTNEQS